LSQRSRAFLKQMSSGDSIEGSIVPLHDLKSYTSSI
jgi:hypothetical protein